MKFLKNNLKVIIAFILGLILAGGIVYAAMSASEITYTTAKNTKIENVEDALNDLYENSKKVNVYNYTNIARVNTKNLKIDIKNDYQDYANITIDNIYVQLNSVLYTSGSASVNNIRYSYENGIIIIDTNYDFFTANRNAATVIIVKDM